jgi:hypothetical protein
MTSCRNFPFATALLAGTALMAAPAMADTPHEAEFANQSVGHWSSKAQSVEEAYSWVDSRTFRILEDREDGVWLYQQNAIVGPDPDSGPEDGSVPPPYFQVVIQFRDMGDGNLHTTTYRMTDRAGGIAFARGEAAFNEEWMGEVACMGTMQRISAGFWSGETECPNNFRGGVKVDSRSIRTPDSYVNWDRGINAEGEHIWGPAAGGYRFERVEEAQ